MRRILIVLSLVVAACGAGATAPPGSTAPLASRAVPGSDPSEARPGVCDSVGEPIAVGTVTEPGLAEISGVVYSRSMPGILWALNDSGAPPRLWAVAGDGTVLGHHDVGARNVDWEDIAIGPGPEGESWIYISDTGDNFGRRTGVWLLRFPEPTAVTGIVADVETLQVAYPDGAADAEALLIDPITGDGFVFTKSDSGVSVVMRIPAGAWVEDRVDAIPTLTLDLGTGEVVTAADISRDGTVMALRTYGDVWLWERDPAGSVAMALLRRPCRAPASSEPQGESVALDDDGYVTVGEGRDSVLYRYDR